MDVHTWDSVFVRASRRTLHPLIADVDGWQRWWPGMTVSRDAHGYDLALRAPGLLARRRNWSVTVVRVRPTLGIALRYAGQVRGEAELYYLDEPDGTVVHYILRGTVPDRGWRAAQREHRAGVRAGLDALKDHLERGRVPGDEPDPALLAEQRRARSSAGTGR